MALPSFKKWALLLCMSLFLISCFSEKKTLDKWLERNIHDLIMQAGPPAQVTSDGSNGKIYVYSISSTSGYTGMTYYTYVFWYVYTDGTIYHWMTRKGAIPPERVDVDLYIHH